jgi:hypothetical protein
MPAATLILPAASLTAFAVCAETWPERRPLVVDDTSTAPDVADEAVATSMFAAAPLDSVTLPPTVADSPALPLSFPASRALAPGETMSPPESFADPLKMLVDPLVLAAPVEIANAPEAPCTMVSAVNMSTGPDIAFDAPLLNRALPPSVSLLPADAVTLLPAFRLGSDAMDTCTPAALPAPT